VRLWRKNYLLADHRSAKRTKNHRPEVPKMDADFFSQPELMQI